MSEQPKSPLREIVQPFIDLIRAPRALWGINLAYCLEGMVYFGMLSYLAIYFSDFVFQSVDHSDEWSHNMVMVLTAGITISMFFLGAIADKKGVRFALIAAFCLMVIGRTFISGAPNVLGLDPVRPGVVAGDRVSLYVTEIATRDGHKTITDATVIENTPEAATIADQTAVDLAAGEGAIPDESLNAKVVKLTRAKIVKGESPEWTVEYGSKPVTATLLIHTSEELGLRAGSTISLRRAYVYGREKKDDKKTVDEGSASAPAPSSSPTLTGEAPVPPAQADAGEKTEAKSYEYIIRTHWIEDVIAIDTFPINLADGDGLAPQEALRDWTVRLDSATVVSGERKVWQVQYGTAAVTAMLEFDSRKAPELCPGATIALHRATVHKTFAASGDASFVIRTEWPHDVTTIGISGCENFAGDVPATQRQLSMDLAEGAGTPLDASQIEGNIRLSWAELVDGAGREWTVRYGARPETCRLLLDASLEPALARGAIIALSSARIEHPKDGASAHLSADWPEDVAAVDTFGCATSPYPAVETARERALKSTARWPAATLEGEGAQAPTVSLAELANMQDGKVNVILRDVEVTYVRNGGYNVQADDGGPALSTVVSPFWSPLHLVTLAGMVLVVIGYGMYQPAAYAAVRQFTTPKTAAMSFAMLYALMNLGGWLPTFAFLARDDDFLGLGIPGTYWIYTAFTVVALLATVIILTPKTVRDTTAAAQAETEAIKAAEAKTAEENAAKDSSNPAPVPAADAPRRVKPHMWLLWVGAVALFLFKSESPWYFAWNESKVRWFLAAIIFVCPVFFASFRRAHDWLAAHPLEDSKFAFFIFALIPVQTLFTYNWLILPQYISRAFSGWIGDYFEIMSNANPLLIFVAVPVITALTQKANVYNMMIIGTLVMAAPAFILCAGPTPWALVSYLLIMTIGEAMWQPRFLQYAAEIAPKGRTGEYMGVAQLPWFLTKVLVPLLYSGRMMDSFCPAEGPKSTEMMWLVFGCIAIVSPMLLLFAKGWIGKDFKTKSD